MSFGGNLHNHDAVLSDEESNCHIRSLEWSLCTLISSSPDRNVTFTTLIEVFGHKITHSVSLTRADKTRYTVQCALSRCSHVVDGVSVVRTLEVHIIGGLCGGDCLSAVVRIVLVRVQVGGVNHSAGWRAHRTTGTSGPDPRGREHGEWDVMWRWERSPRGPCGWNIV